MSKRAGQNYLKLAFSLFVFQIKIDMAFVATFTDKYFHILQGKQEVYCVASHHLPLTRPTMHCEW